MDGRMEHFALMYQDGSASVHNVADGARIAYFPSFGSLPNDGDSLSPSGRFLAHRCNPNGRLNLWRLDGPKPVQVLKEVATGNHTSTISFRPDGSQLAVAQPDAAVVIFDTATGARLHRYSFPGLVERLAFHPTRPFLAVSSGTTLRVLDVETGNLVADLPQPAPVGCLAWHPNGRTLAAASVRDVHLWDVSSGKKLLDLTGHTSAVYRCVFNHASDRIITGDWSGMWRLWDSQTGQLLRRVPRDRPS